MDTAKGNSTAEWAVGKVFLTQGTLFLNGIRERTIDSDSIVWCKSLENGVLLFREYETNHEWTARNDDVFLLLEEDSFLTRHIKNMTKKQVTEYSQYTGVCKSMRVFGIVTLLMGIAMFIVLSFFSSVEGFSMWLTVAVSGVFIAFAILSFAMRFKHKRLLKRLKAEVTEEPYTPILET